MANPKRRGRPRKSERTSSGDLANTQRPEQSPNSELLQAIRDLETEKDILAKWLILAVYCLGGELTATPAEGEKATRGKYLHYSESGEVMKYELKDLPPQPDTTRGN